MMLYRVIVRSTSSLQGTGYTFWNKEVIYCGYDHKEAARVYHKNQPCDVYRGAGNPCVKTVIERAEPTEQIDDMEWKED